jgi:hypothetical protein
LQLRLLHALQPLAIALRLVSPLHRVLLQVSETLSLVQADSRLNGWAQAETVQQVGRQHVYPDWERGRQT